MAQAGHMRMAEQGGDALQCLSGTIPPHPRPSPPVPASRPALPLWPWCPARSLAHAVQSEAWLAPGILLALSELLVQLLNETHAQQRPGVPQRLSLTSLLHLCNVLEAPPSPAARSLIPAPGPGISCRRSFPFCVRE